MNKEYLTQLGLFTFLGLVLVFVFLVSPTYYYHICSIEKRIDDWQYDCHWIRKSNFVTVINDLLTEENVPCNKTDVIIYMDGIHVICRSTALKYCGNTICLRADYDES